MWLMTVFVFGAFGLTVSFYVASPAGPFLPYFVLIGRLLSIIRSSLALYTRGVQ